MRLLKYALILLMLAANIVLVKPAFADPPKYTKNPDYIEVTKTLNELMRAKQAQNQGQNYSQEEIQKRIDELQFQKYALETGTNWGQCRNESGKTVAVYGPQPDLDDDDLSSQYANGLYFLADGQTTKNKWDCEGVYLPNDAKIAGIGSNKQDLGGPVAVKIADGTQLSIKTNPITGALEFNVPPAKVLKSGEANWFIPNVSQSVINGRVANAPSVKNVDRSTIAVGGNANPTVVNNTPRQTQTEPQPQPQPQVEIQPVLPEKGYYSEPPTGENRGKLQPLLPKKGYYSQP